MTSDLIQRPVIVIEHGSEGIKKSSLIGYAETMEEAVGLAEATGYRVMLYEYDAEQCNWNIEFYSDE